MNVGIEKALEVVKSVDDCELAVPELDGKKVDFNDLAQARGPEAVKTIIEAACAASSTTTAPDGAALLDDIEHFIGRFVAYPSEYARVAHALWIAHTHLMEAWESTPRIAFLSPEKESGKSRAMEVTETLVPRAVRSVNASPAYMFRKVADEAGAPTILFDEIDTVFGPKAKDNEEIRGMLNAGHRRGATAGRCVVRGVTVSTEELPAYCAVALAGLGWLPDTIISRSVVVRMKKRRQAEKVEPWRLRLWPQGEALRDRLAAWADAVRPRILASIPDMPVGVEDRDADVWEALIAVANAAGGAWPARARAAAVALVAESKQSSPSLRVQLLDDLREIFGDRESMWTDEIVTTLIARDEAPWGSLRGKPIDARQLAGFLEAYDVRPANIRIGEVVRRGYRRSDLHDPWSRYLPVPDKAATSATSTTAEPPDQPVSGPPVPAG